MSPEESSKRVGGGQRDVAGAAQLVADGHDRIDGAVIALRIVFGCHYPRVVPVERIVDVQLELQLMPVGEAELPRNHEAEFPIVFAPQRSIHIDHGQRSTGRVRFALVADDAGTAPAKVSTQGKPAQKSAFTESMGHEAVGGVFAIPVRRATRECQFIFPRLNLRRELGLDERGVRGGFGAVGGEIGIQVEGVRRLPGSDTAKFRREFLPGSDALKFARGVKIFAEILEVFAEDIFVGASAQVDAPARVGVEGEGELMALRHIVPGRAEAL